MGKSMVCVSATVCSVTAHEILRANQLKSIILGVCFTISAILTFIVFLTLFQWKHSSSSVNNRRGKKNLVLSSWGDESTLSEGYVNPHYVSDYYKSYSERTNQNLKRLNEDVIDFDLLEDLICYIDENCPPGALLVFLPVRDLHQLNALFANMYLTLKGISFPTINAAGSCRD
jgi:hypothetical protein